MNQEGDVRKKKSGKIFRKVLGIFFLSSLLIVIAIYFFFDDYIKYKIIRKVNRSSDGLYNLRIENLDAEFWSGAIIMNGVRLNPDEKKLMQMREKNPLAYISNVKIDVDFVSISSINWLPYLLNYKSLEVGRVQISEPNLYFRSQGFGLKENVKDKDKDKDNKTFLEYAPRIIAAFTGALRIESIHLAKGKIHVDLHSRSGILHQVADSIEIDLSKIVIDTLQNDALNLKTAYLDFRNYSLTSPNEKHSLSVKRFYGKVQDSTLIIQNVVYNKNDINSSKYPNTFSLDIESMASKGINFRTLLQDKKVIVRTLTFKHPKVRLLSDRTPFNKKDTLPEKESKFTFLDDIAPFIYNTFTMDTFAFENGSIVYNIRNSHTEILQSVDNIYLDLIGIKIDSTKRKDLRKLYIDNAHLGIKNLKYSKDSNTFIRIASIEASVKDSSLSLKNAEVKSLGDFSFQIKSPVFIGKGVDIRKLANTQQLILNEFKIHNPEISITHDKKRKSIPHNSNPSYTRNLFAETLGSLANSGIQANLLEIDNGNIKHIIRTSRGLIQQYSTKVNISIVNIRLDSSTTADHKYYDNVVFNLKDYTAMIHHENIKFHVNDVIADSKNRNLTLNEIEVSQIKSFGPHQKYFFTNNFKSAVASNFDFERFVNSRKLHSNSLNINGMDLKILLDKGVPVFPKFVRKTPQDLMKKLPFYLRLDTMRIYDSKITYISKKPDVEVPTELSFEQLNVTVYNLTNDSLLMTESTPAVIKGNALLMGEGSMNFDVAVPFLSQGFDAHFSGTFDTMPAMAFNSLLASKSAEIENGIILPGEFLIDVKDGSAVGNLKFAYQDLHVNVMHSGTHKVSKIKSLVANFILKNNNPKHEDNQVEVVPLCGKRMPDDGFFHFFITLIKTGIITTVTKDSIYKRIAKR